MLLFFIFLVRDLELLFVGVMFKLLGVFVSGVLCDDVEEVYSLLL